jgi:two-component system, cell cycle response regulator
MTDLLSESTKQMNKGRRAKILVVDDEPFNVDYLEQELEELNYETLSAANGREALAQIESGHSDVVLLDIMMPVMDGFQVLTHLKATSTWRDLPVIVISAMTDMRSVVKGIKLGADDYLPKPFDDVLLKARLHACVEKKWLRDQEMVYLRAVAALTAAAAAVEASTFDPQNLLDVAGRDDDLGQLVRLFAQMAREVAAREQRLQEQVQELRIEIDKNRQARQVSQITSSDYFRQLRGRAGELRNLLDEESD